MKTEWNREWIKSIDLDKLNLYPIQFSNCDRLRANDAVYIFDEVGSGKTISSGLMALDYLRNHKNEKVLIITINSLVKKLINSEYGQFLNDWKEKLPFTENELEKRIEIVNNIYRNIPSGKYGLVIIDEAHLFLNKETKRYKSLLEIEADKVVFLTATPIKENRNDLYTYVDLARKIIKSENEKINANWIDEICNSNNTNRNNVICSKFDVGYPVTRYFKDTIKSINENGYRKTRARRVIPEIWKYENYDKKNSVLIDNMLRILKERSDSRFVIFTKFVKDEAEKLGTDLNKKGFLEIPKGRSINFKEENEMTYKIITGENSGELSQYSKKENLPTVLILTYQIAEQGVNLPGFDHIINYNIPAFPSSLEQRMGRIDRMNSDFEKIKVCYIISEKPDPEERDSDTNNFYVAIRLYLKSLIRYIPSKNTILSANLISEYKKNYVKFDEGYKQYIKKILKENKENLQYIIKNNNEDIEITNPEMEVIQNLIEDGNIEISEETSVEELTQKITNQVLWVPKSESFEDIEKKMLDGSEDGIYDKIFYYENDSLETIDAIEECGKNIGENFQFTQYKKEFDENIKVATVYKGNIIKNLIMDCQSYTKYRPNETTGGIFVSWRRKEELPTGA